MSHSPSVDPRAILADWAANWRTWNDRATAAEREILRLEINKLWLPRELWRGPRGSRQRKPRIAPPNGLRTSAEAAAKLGCSIKTLNGYIAAGALKYVAIGHGSKRPRKMFTDADLDQFIANQTRKDSPACHSIVTRARHIGTSTSSGAVIAFTALPKPRPGAKPKR